jgi:hypothetical protein
MGGDGINPNGEGVFYIHIDGEDEIEFTVDCPWSGHVLSKMIIKQHLSQVAWCDGCFVRSEEPEAGNEVSGCTTPSANEIWNPNSNYNPINPQWDLLIEPLTGDDGGPLWMAKPEDADGQNVPEEEYSQIAVHYNADIFSSCVTRWKNSYGGGNEVDPYNCEEANDSHPQRSSGWSWEKARDGKAPGYNIDDDDCCAGSDTSLCAPIQGHVPDICCDCAACDGAIPLGNHPGTQFHYSKNIYNCEPVPDVQSTTCHEDDKLCVDCSDEWGDAWPYMRCPNSYGPPDPD